jgi:hypothetical protein
MTPIRCQGNRCIYCYNRYLKAKKFKKKIIDVLDATRCLPLHNDVVSIIRKILSINTVPLNKLDLLLNMAAGEGDLFILEYVFKYYDKSIFKDKNNLNNGIDIYINKYLINAGKCGQLDAVKFLHKMGGDIHCHNSIMIIDAASEGHLDIVKYLCDNNIDVTSMGSYAIKIASKKNHNDVVRYIKKKYWAKLDKKK